MKAALALVLLLLASRAGADDSALRDEIARADAAMFDAFNRHDVDGLMASFTEDLEFYHDKDGLLGHAQVTSGFQRLFAANKDLRRDLVPGSLEVYPLGKWGALEVGRHRFCHEENGRQDCGTFHFSHVWQRVGDGWKVRRVLSYGH